MRAFAPKHRKNFAIMSVEHTLSFDTLTMHGLLWLRNKSDIRIYANGGMVEALL